MFFVLRFGSTWRKEAAAVRVSTSSLFSPLGIPLLVDSFPLSPFPCPLAPSRSPDPNAKLCSLYVMCVAESVGGWPCRVVAGICGVA